MDPEAGSLARWSTFLALAGAVLGTAVHAILLDLPVVDDAAISIAYGHSLLSGAGLRLTPGSPPVEGFSNPLWVVLLGLSRPLGLEPLAFSRWLGVILGALALVFVALAVPAASGRRLRPADAVGPLVVAASPNYAYWICSGMESGLHALLLAASVWALVRDFRLRRGLTSGLLLAGLALTRPEAPLVIVVAAGFWMLWLFEEDRSPGRPEAILLGVLGLVACAYLAFRWAYFARLLPNTYFAKLSWDFRPARYLEGFARAYPLPLILAAGLGALGLLSRISRRPASLAFTFILCGVAFVWRVKADWMDQWRFLGPLWPLLGILVCAGLSALTQLSEGAPAAVRGSVIPLVAALGVLGLAVPAELGRFNAARREAGFSASFVRDKALELRQRLAALGIEQARLGLADIGGAALALRADRIVDVAGLADYALAEHGGNFRAMQDYLVGEGLPDVIDAHGPSGHVSDFARLMGHYRSIGDRLWLLEGLERGRDPRCPDGAVSSVLGPEASELRRQLERLIDASDPGRAVDLVRCIQAHRPAAFTELRSLSARALEAAGRAERLGGLEWALRFSSLATILADENAHLRRRTELLRHRLFPPTRHPGTR
ncbi:MAG: hypothetical protein EHM78_08885 [Myxococcaceae bacterium]|nr:MAG: hypothetical protein EHM78_08885 [Myxococcaceae bacterium]